MRKQAKEAVQASLYAQQAAKSSVIKKEESTSNEMGLMQITSCWVYQQNPWLLRKKSQPRMRWN